MKSLGIRTKQSLHHLRTLVFAGVMSTVLASCSGGGSSPAPLTLGPALTSTSNTKTSVGTSVQVSYELPQDIQSDQAFKARTLQYISSSNLSLSVVVTPLGGSAMAAVVGSCTTVTCTVNFTANPGPNTLAFTLTDTSGGGGNILSKFSSELIVRPIAITTLNLTANPVVNSVVVQLSSAGLNAGVSGNVTVTVQALDADGKTIVGPGNYVDANGNPLAFFLSGSTNQAGGNGAVSLQGPMRIISPTQTATYAHYNAGWAASGTISIGTTGTILGSLTGATLTIIPQVVSRYVVPTASSGPFGITSGPNGTLWFTEQNTNKIVKLSTAGSFTEYTVPTTNSQPSIITAGNDGKLWFSEFNANKIASITTNGTFTEYLVTSLASGTTYVTVGPDGNIWFTETNTNKIGRLVPQTNQMTEFTITTASSSPEGITAGPDGNLWFIEQSTNKIGRITTSGTITEFGIPTSGSVPLDITAGPDGNVWFTETTGNKIGSITPSGTISEYTIAASGANPRSIIAGPDGALWFVEPLNNTIGRVTTSGTFSTYSLPVASAIPLGLVVGPDGNLWLAENGNNVIDKFVY